MSAVDFNEDFLMTGYEDANVGVWSMASGQQIHNMLGQNNNNNNKNKIIIIIIIIGHNGGVTGIQIQLNLAASSSYDSTVIIHNLDLKETSVCTLSNSATLAA